MIHWSTCLLEATTQNFDEISQLILCQKKKRAREINVDANQCPDLTTTYVLHVGVGIPGSIRRAGLFTTLGQQKIVCTPINTVTTISCLSSPPAKM